MRRLDAWLLRRMERFAYWTQDWFGITSYRWCQVCLSVFGVVQWADVMNYFMPSVQWTEPFAGDIFTAPVASIYIAVAFCHFQHAQAQWYEGQHAVRHPPMLGEPRTDRLLRYIFVGMFALMASADLLLTVLPAVPPNTLKLGAVAHTCAITAVATYFYMAMVHPRPYQRRRVLVPAFRTGV